jgi:hypothetical protein
LRFAVHSRKHLLLLLLLLLLFDELGPLACSDSERTSETI